jgi:hypothetical protein
MGLCRTRMIVATQRKLRKLVFEELPGTCKFGPRYTMRGPHTDSDDDDDTPPEPLSSKAQGKRRME